jgi:hypothetical protein
MAQLYKGGFYMAQKKNRYPIIIDGETALIGTANELSIALDVLQGQYDRDSLAQLRPHLAEIIAHANGLMMVLRSLSIDDQIFLLKAIGPDLVDVIKSASHLRDLLAITSDQSVEETLLTTLGTDGLRKLIMTGEELAEVLEWVYGEQDTLTLELLGDVYMRQLCRHATDISAILRNIDFPLQASFLEQLGWSHIVGLVKDGYDLASLMRALPAELSARLLKQYTVSQLVALIGNADEWTYLYQRLEPAETDLMVDLFNLR